ncbi:MAG: hypothetical protein M3Z35_16875 [Nitrospirota bacterium]|nr:hypothetical protein [Nitrospirota bacterium]
MPLIIVLFIGILAFGLFDFILGLPLPVAARQHSVQQTLNSLGESANLPSIPVVATSETARCERHDSACQLVALYRFVQTTVTPEASRSPWLHTQQHPARTLFMRRGDAVDIAILFSSLLDQRHIRNYVVMLPKDSYVLACDISPSALYHAGGHWQPPTPALDPSHIVTADDSTGAPRTEWIDAYALNVGDAPCPCLLLNPSGPINQQPGDPLPFLPGAFRSALDVGGSAPRLNLIESA